MCRRSNDSKYTELYSVIRQGFFTNIPQMEKIVDYVTCLNEYSVATLYLVLCQEAGSRGDQLLVEELYSKHMDYLIYSSGQQTALMRAAS